jgi:hypothetical protein
MSIDGAATRPRGGCTKAPATDEEVGTGHEPDGLCGRRDEHRAHMVVEGSLAPFWCTADQSQREPGSSERRSADR